MGTELPAEGFLRHKGLILTAAGGAVVEGGLLTLLAPNARSVAPQVTALPPLACSWPQNVVFVDAFHGGLLGDASVRQMVEDFLAGGTPSRDSPSQRGLRRAATLIAAAGTAWRMPELHPACSS